MKITIKTLKKVSYDMEVSPEADTVEVLKNNLEKKFSLDSKTMKLMFNGVVLDDSKLLAEYKVTEGCSIMLMSVKAKPINTVKEESKTEEPVPVNKTETNKDKPIIAEKTAKPVSKPKKEAPQVDYTTQVANLVEMGFTGDVSLKAIQAAKGNLSLAIEYLYNGIPAGNSQVPVYSDFLGGNESDEYEEGEPYAIEIDPEALNNLNLNDPQALSNIASIVKVIINEDPSMLESLLGEIEESNPEIIEFIKEREQEFKSLIESPITEEDVLRFNNLMPGAGEEPINMENLEDMLVHSQGAQNSQFDPSTLNLTESEKAAVERLKDLGFPEIDVLQAYIACNKDEMQAANFLLENKYKEGNDMNVDGNRDFNFR